MLSPFGPLRQLAAAQPNEKTAAGAHELRPGMRMRWNNGAPPPAADAEVAAGTAWFVFVLKDTPPSAAPPATGGNPFGSVGWMTLIPPAALAALRPHTLTASFHLIVELRRDVLLELFKNDAGQNGAFVLQIAETHASVATEPVFLPLTPAARLAVESVRRCPLAGACRTLVLGARGHDLLVEFISASAARPVAPPPPMFDTETRVRAAAAALARRIEETPSLETLAREVGLSETTLKRGFRQIFGTTVFEHLRTLRMERARALLQSGQATVLEAATLVGYSNPSNFAAAFRRQFGLNPKEFQLAARR